MRKLALSDEILLNIEKPARYIGNEVNSVMKDPEKVDIRFAMCFPDVYEIGMSYLGIQILYDMSVSYTHLVIVSFSIWVNSLATLSPSPKFDPNGIFITTEYSTVLKARTDYMFCAGFFSCQKK